MNNPSKRDRDDSTEHQVDEPEIKCIKTPSTESNTRFELLRHGRGRPLPKGIAERMSEEDKRLMEDIKTSCTEIDNLSKAIQLRMKYRLSLRLPEDLNDSSYYIENGLRKVYPYSYVYQSYVKPRWIKRRLMDVLKEEFRDISNEMLTKRFDDKKILVNGSPVTTDFVLKDNDFISNLTHRHELPVLAAPLKIIYQDKDTLVIDKPPSLPIHPCGRYRHNSVMNILKLEYHIPDIKVVHRLDRLVSGVLILALNTQRAHELEIAIRARNVQKQYVCRVVGEFPVDNSSEDGEIIVDEPLATIPNKIGITAVLPDGKPSVTKFKRLSYNGKTSAVLCKPVTGRMHQIRVHLQFLGHPIVNDGLYNCDSFGPERGKGARYGKSLKQVSDDVVAKHRASTWIISESSEFSSTNDLERPVEDGKDANSTDLTSEFISEEEKEETLAALEHFFDDESCNDLEKKFKFNPDLMNLDTSCRDCLAKYYDTPKRYQFLYLHALKYTGPNWSYESNMPKWALESWKY